MSLALVGLADALRAAGVPVAEYPGWAQRGQTDGSFYPRAVMWHHDASALGDSPGVPAYMANLDNTGAQCWVDRYGVWHLVAAGRMWHAGTGGGWGVIPPNDGNTYSVGIETDHTTGEDWPSVQVAMLRRGTAVLLAMLGADPFDALCGHKEYRITNPDPDGLDMTRERVTVSEIDLSAPGDGGAQHKKKRKHMSGMKLLRTTGGPAAGTRPAYPYGFTVECIWSGGRFRHSYAGIISDADWSARAPQYTELGILMETVDVITFFNALTGLWNDSPTALVVDVVGDGLGKV